MPEAVIVATARSPIGRANKGSLKDLRPDDLTVQVVQAALDNVPGATITRYCSSSIQTTRMAFHAIKAGESDVVISAGVETVSRYVKGTSDHLPDTLNPAFAEAKAHTD